MYERKISLFELADPMVKKWTVKWWNKIVTDGKLDLTLYSKDRRMVYVDTIEHKDVREVGSEWMCYNIWQKLRIDEVLQRNGFSEQEIKLAQTQVISRAVHPTSELATAKWIKENSAICELTGFPAENMNKDRLYRGSKKLYEIKEDLEQHLSLRTNELFDIQDKILLYDLTNTYFEGEKRNSKLAKFGRSKEKRSDARLIVLALVVNTFGFIKYSSIHEGNFADSAGLEKVIDQLDYAKKAKAPIVVIDAGIATEANLQMIRSKGYHYLCVSRKKLTDYQIDNSRLTVLMETKSKYDIVLKKVADQEDRDYHLEVTSVKKALKEQVMKDQFEMRFEQELEKIKASLHKKGGTKKVEKVHQRIGRVKQKYPSVHNRYEVKTTTDKNDHKVIDLQWVKDINKEEQKLEGLGRYFLRTSLEMKDEVVIWNVYNTIREVESTFRTLKTDLDLRPIYHKSDESTLAHLNLGLLSYWLANTIRCQLKSKGIRHCWKEIVRIGNTQKVITTVGYNKANQEIKVRKCSQASKKLKKLQAALDIKHRPFVKLKSVVHKLKVKNQRNQQIQAISSG
jgi:transposase